MLRFIIGLVSGIAIGVAASNASQGQSGKDWRAELELIRKDLQQGDFEALGAHLEERFKELQSSLEARFGDAAKVADDAGSGFEDAVEDLAEEVEEMAEDLEAEAVKV